MSGADAFTMPLIEVPTDVELDNWLTTQELPEHAERPVWKPSGSGRGVTVRSVEHLATLMNATRRRGQRFGTVEWPRPFPQPWAQTAAARSEFIVELNDGGVELDREFPCTRRAFRGRPGQYPPPDEHDPRYKTSAYPLRDMELFTALEGASVIWTWITTQSLVDGVAVTMRHFGAGERQYFGCGDE